MTKRERIEAALQKKEVEIDGTVDMLQYSGTPGRGVFGKWFG